MIKVYKAKQNTSIHMKGQTPQAELDHMVLETEKVLGRGRSGQVEDRGQQRA